MTHMVCSCDIDQTNQLYCGVETDEVGVDVKSLMHHGACQVCMNAHRLSKKSMAGEYRKPRARSKWTTYHQQRNNTAGGGL